MNPVPVLYRVPAQVERDLAPLRGPARAGRAQAGELAAHPAQGAGSRARSFRDGRTRVVCRSPLTCPSAVPSAVRWTERSHADGAPEQRAGRAAGAGSDGRLAAQNHLPQSQTNSVFFFHWPPPQTGASALYLRFWQGFSSASPPCTSPRYFHRCATRFPANSCSTPALGSRRSPVRRAPVLGRAEPIAPAFRHTPAKRARDVSIGAPPIAPGRRALIPWRTPHARRPPAANRRRTASGRHGAAQRLYGRQRPGPSWKSVMSCTLASAVTRSAQISPITLENLKP